MMQQTSVETAGRTPAGALSVTGGEVYELRLRLTAEDDRPLPCLADVTLSFRDARGAVVDPALADGEVPQVGLDPLRVEVLPALPEDRAAAITRAADKLKAAATATRYVLAPPDAVTLSVAVATPGIAMADLVVRALSVDWTRETRALVTHSAAETELRLALIDSLFPGLARGADAVTAAMAEIPAAQLAAIGESYAPAGDWGAVLDRLDLAPQLADFDARAERLAAARAVTLRVGFIGTARTYDRLRCLADVFWLREEVAEAQIAALAPDLVILETSAESGPGDWNHAFHSAGGDLPAPGAALVALLRAADVPLHVLASCPPSAAFAWRAAFAAADRRVIEGTGADWPDRADAHVIRRATEPAAGPAMLLHARDPDLTLVPCGSDVFQDPAFRAFLTARHCHDTLISDFHHGFAPHALKRYIAPREPHLYPQPTAAQKRYLLQNATLVLLPGRSTRSDQEMCDLATDAIAAGAIPVIVGPTDLSGPVFDALDRVMTPRDLQRLQRGYRAPWLQERRWRTLYRLVSAQYRWRAEDRTALLGRDPFPADFDTPRFSAVLVSKRLHLLESCLAQFRAQSWPETELIVVLHRNAMPADLPELRDNERIFTAPEHFNLGQCLNLGIAEATGRYWAKIDDDDFYSPTYAEEYVRYFHDTQADALGGQAVYFYFAGPDETRDRARFARHCHSILKPGRYLAGPTLAARRTETTLRFSNERRNGSDAEWVDRMQAAGKRIACYGFTHFVMYRDADESKHTWALSVMGRGVDGMTRRQAGNIHDRLTHER